MYTYLHDGLTHLVMSENVPIDLSSGRRRRQVALDLIGLAERIATLCTMDIHGKVTVLEADAALPNAMFVEARLEQIAILRLPESSVTRTVHFSAKRLDNFPIRL